MLHTLVRFAILFLLFQCMQGRLLRRFNANSDRHSQGSSEVQFENWLYSNAAGEERVNVGEVSQGRARRQTDDPVAFSSTLFRDSRQFGRISYSGGGSEVIFVITYDISSRSSRVLSSNLYRSTDYGKTFQSLSSKFPSGFRLHPILYTFSNSKTVILGDNLRASIYVTNDEGATFRTYTVPVDPKTLKVHPTMPGWLLGHNSNQRALMFSKNSGISWNIVARNVYPSGANFVSNDFTWGEPGIDWDVDNPDPGDISKVFYNFHDHIPSSSSENYRILRVASNPGDGYQSKVFDCDLGLFDSFILDGTFIFAARITTSSGQTQLYVSYMRMPFNLTRIPRIDRHFSYIVGSYRSSQGLVIVEHSNFYNLYFSDETGTYYSLSLERLVVDDSTGSIDLELINSVNGTMIANQFTLLPSSGQFRNRTLITFDNGARWQSITAPANLTPSCTQPCSLHFHIESSTAYRRLGVYDRSSAPGIIVAHGNPGSYLTDDVSVYISRDGGLSWSQTLNSSWDIEIIDHGGLLVAARDNHQDLSNSIMYSCDEGMSWRDFVFLSDPIVVWGVITEPGQTTTQVLLFGNAGLSDSPWIVIHINFTSIFLRTCLSSDYYNWTVSDGRNAGQACLLGEQRVIERRQPAVCCWNSRQYERLVATNPCLCGVEDYECEWGYRRIDNLGNCTLDVSFGTNRPSLDCLTGYRKIAGDTCVNGSSSIYLPPDDCVPTVRPSPSVDCSTILVPVPSTAGTILVPLPSTAGTSTAGTFPVPSTTDDGNSGKNTGSNDDNNNTAVTASVVVVVVLITLATIAIIIAGVVYFAIKKRKNVSSHSEASSGAAVTMPQAAIVGGDEKYRKLKEDE